MALTKTFLQNKIDDVFEILEGLDGHLITLIVPKYNNKTQNNIISDVPCLLSSNLSKTDGEEVNFQENLKIVDIRIKTLEDLNDAEAKPIIPIPPNGSLKDVGTQVKIYGKMYTIRKEDTPTGFNRLVRLYCEKVQT